MTTENIINTCACSTTIEPDTESNPDLNPNANQTTKQHAIVNIQQVTRPREKFTRDVNVVAPF